MARRPFLISFSLFVSRVCAAAYSCSDSEHAENPHSFMIQDTQHII